MNFIMIGLKTNDMKKNDKEEVYLFVINELVKEKRNIEERMSLPKGWVRLKDHPRLGEVLAVFPNILKSGRLDK